MTRLARLCIPLLAVTSAATATPPGRPVKYSYTGPSFIDSQGCLTTTMHASFILTLAARLPANFAGYVMPLAWMASNGLHNFRNSSPGTNMDAFWFATGADGHITQWTAQAYSYDKAGALNYAAASHHQADAAAYDTASDWCGKKTPPGTQATGHGTEDDALAGGWTQP